MAFFHYSQNNSGGFYVGPEHVIVEADNAAEADQIAQGNGVYFDGVRVGKDCGCCGDRWTTAEFWDDEGDSEPSIYGEPAVESENCQIIRKLT